MRLLIVATTVLLLLGNVVVAQETKGDPNDARPTESKPGAVDTTERKPGAVETKPGADESAAERLERKIREGLKLPGAAEDARDGGVGDEEVRVVLDRGRKGRLPAEDMKIVLEEERRAVDEHGPIDNFGAFVQSKLDEGLSGRELADAIHQEHAARGKGKHAKGKGKGQQKDKDKDTTVKHEKGDPDHDDDDRDHDDPERKGKAKNTRPTKKGGTN